MQPDAEMLAGCRRGEAAAWDALFDKYYAAAARFIFQLGSDFTHEDAEEICQETFLAVIKNLASFHGESQFQTWLFRIAANKARDYRERRQAAKRGGSAITLSLHAVNGDDEPALDPSSPLPGPADILMMEEQASEVHHALERLEPPCREIIELRYFGDLSYEELAGTLHLNPKTVSSRLSKCLDRLVVIMRKIISGAKTPAFPSNK